MSGRRHPTLAWTAFVLCLVAGNLLLQLLLGGRGLDNQPVNAYRPTSSDALVYIAQAQQAAAGEFYAAFADGFRPPGYPLFLAVCLRLFAQPLLAARLIQIGLTALVIPLAFATLRRALGDPRRAAPGALLVALWLPLYYFSPVLVAESLSIFLAAVALWLMARAVAAAVAPAAVAPAAVALGAVAAALVYAKPNHIFLALPVAAFLWAGGARRGAAIFVLTLAAALLPWTAFISAANGRLIPLSSTSGVNLYLGTGAAGGDGAGDLPSAVAGRLGLVGAPPAARAAAQAAQAALSPSEQDSLYSGAAAEVWRARPGATALYGLSKAAHAFGFSLRGGSDAVQVGLFVAALAASLWLWRARRQRPWALFLWVLIAVTALQAFLFLSNQRFKVVVFDLPALLVVGLAVGEWLGARAGRARNGP